MVDVISQSYIFLVYNNGEHKHHALVARGMMMKTWSDLLIGMISPIDEELGDHNLGF